MKAIRWFLGAISLMGLCSCSCLTSQVDREISALAAQVQQLDIHPAYDQAPTATPAVLPPPSEESTPAEKTSLAPAESNSVTTAAVKSELPPAEREPPTQEAPDKEEGPNTLLPAVALQQLEKKPPPRLVIPPNLPGAKAPELPRYPREPEQQKRYLEQNFPPLPPAPQLRPPAPGPEGRPMTLADLQRLAALYSPDIQKAEAAVEAAKGAAKQAGAYPNPYMFFEQDTVGTGSAGYEGFGLHQTVKTGNKLKLQQAAAMMDVLNAQLALKRTYLDVSYAVRTNYFAVLVARESVKVNQALYEFADEIYRIQVEYVPGQLAAPYEPMQLRPLVLQARFSLIQAQNQYLASWRQLAAALGLRDMPPTDLAGSVDMPMPVFNYKEVLARVLANHTDVRTAYNQVQQAKFNLQLAKVTPVPDVDLNILGQKDYTAPPNVIAHSLQFAVPVPVFNQNAGGIKQATGALAQAIANVEQTRNTLTQTLADAYNRYQTNREYVAITQQQVQDQFRVYRHMRQRWEAGMAGGVGFTDLVFAQQTLTTYIANYITALGLQWLAVSDVANLLQTDDLFQVGPRKEMLPVPDLKQLNPRSSSLHCALTSSKRARQAGKGTQPVPPPNGSLSTGAPVAPTGTPDEASSQPAAAAQPADAADDKRSREASNPKRG